jgi:hypothetical protein
MLNGHRIDLAHYLAEPEAATELNREELGELLVQIMALQCSIIARLAGPERDDRQRKTAGAEPLEQMLTPAEAATLLHQKVRWVYDHAAELGACPSNTDSRL